MKRFLLVATLLVLSPLAIAGTPRVDARQARQHTRIDQGISDGTLTPREAARLDAQQVRIDRREQRAKSDGIVTGRERARLTRSQNRANRNIRRQKHDAQHRH